MMEALSLVSLGRQRDVVFQIQLGLGVFLGFLKVEDEIVFDGEDGVGLTISQPVSMSSFLTCLVSHIGNSQILVPPRIQLRSAPIIAIMRNHNMNMRRPHRMPIHHLQQLETRPVRRQAVRRRMQTIKPILAILIRAKFPAQVIRRLVVRVLEIIFPVAARLPDIKHRPGNPFPFQIANDTVHLGHPRTSRRRIHKDTRAQFAKRRIRTPKRAQDRTRRRIRTRFRHNFMRNFVDETLEPQNVAQAVRLVARAVGGGVDGAHGVDVLHAGVPLVDGELDLARKVVDVADEGAEDLAVAGGGFGAHCVDYAGREGWVEAGGGGGRRAAVGAGGTVCAVG